MRCQICNQELSKFEQLIAYHDSSTYVCHGCCADLCDIDMFDFTENHAPWKIALKIFFGAICIFSCFYASSFSVAIINILLGLALIAWAVVPIISEKMKCDSTVARYLKEQNKFDNRAFRCQVCGAIAHGDTCEYCGAPFVN